MKVKYIWDCELQYEKDETHQDHAASVMTSQFVLIPEIPSATETKYTLSSKH